MSDDLKQKSTSKSAYLNEINRYIALFHLDLMTLRKLLMSPSYRFNMFKTVENCLLLCNVVINSDSKLIPFPH